MVDNRCPMVIDFRAKLPVFLIASVGSPLAVFLSGRQPIEPSILSPLVGTSFSGTTHTFRIGLPR